MPKQVIMIILDTGDKPAYELEEKRPDPSVLLAKGAVAPMKTYNALEHFFTDIDIAVKAIHIVTVE